MTAPKCNRIPMDDRVNWELARHIETERMLGRFEFRDGEVLVLDGGGDVRSSTLVAMLRELIESTPDAGAGLYLDLEIGPSKSRFRVLSGWEVPPMIFYCIGAGAVMLKYESNSWMA